MSLHTYKLVPTGAEHDNEARFEHHRVCRLCGQEQQQMRGQWETICTPSPDRTNGCQCASGVLPL